ncbi:MAG: 16S rRNA (uracil(1498)-N(3))-methyltransferase [Peptococcaceae bacterium]|jgi:16S rRNA (uracil1498-N3)-methyltransferase|nr:16S rRNA (uracil(1498)-N(3))-methyltransferase [Peptococcaceae bacterium]
MHRFRAIAHNQGCFLITGDELHHLTKVLRLQRGDKVYGFDNSGRQWLGIIEKLEKDSALCRIIEEEYPEVEAKSKVYLVMGLAKGDKMEWVIQKATELGMAGFIPLRTRRSVMQLEGKKAEDRVKRWQKIAGEAAKQSRRVIEPKIEQVAEWKDLEVMLPPETQWLIAYENEKKLSFSNTLASFNPEYPIAVLIGPEGGFSGEEVREAQEKLGARSISLGSRILRTETAALAVLTMVLTYFGDLG